MERLQKLLSSAGVCSRRKAEELIAAGRVTVNGALAVMGQSADLEKDEVMVDGVRIKSAAEEVYYILNKPRGYVTTLSDEKSRPCITDLMADCPHRVYPVGRLDMYSEGLLLLTNDGAAANALGHPSHRVEKEYLARIEGDVSADYMRLAGPFTLDGRKVTAGVKLIRVQRSENGKGASTLLSVTISQGRNRQIRRMCALAQLPLRRLKRIREGELKLGDLAPGTWRELN
ncbi:MAG: rRNA pseudouridine synthase, partial [Oscillospiraceae bacterium]|nr:rRNA pseudouridine synthase [Oscillospiraceae bacterium]